MALKKPSDLFGKKGDKFSKNVNGRLNNIKHQFDKVEELKRELEGVTNSIDNSLSEVVDSSELFDFKEEYSEEINKLNRKIQGIKEDFDDKIDELRAAHLTLNTEITILDKRQNSLHIRGLKDEVIAELQNILNGNVYQNIRSLEEKFDNINKKQLQNLQEGLLNEPPNVDNSDPLTPLNKKYVTLDEFQEQYKLFINRIQKQLATFGGGGAVRIQDLDDVDISTAKVNNKFLKYNSTSGKWEGADASGGGSGITTEFVNAQNLKVAGLSTFVGLTTFMSDIYIVGNQLLTINDALDVRGNNGGNSFITHYIDDADGSPGNLYISNISGNIENDALDNFSVKTNFTEQAILATKNGSVALYHDGGNKKIETLSIGATVTGTLFATSFSGDGSGLTGVVGSGSGVVVQHDGSNVGTAGTINFSTNLDVTPIHAGIVTVTASGITTETIRSDDIVTDGITVGVGTFTICGTNSFTANSVVVDGITTSTSFSGDGSGLTGVLKNVVEDTSPQLGGNLDIQSREINTSATNGNIKLTPNGSGYIEVKGAGGNDGTIQLNCSANSHGVKIKSPPHSAAATYTLTLPDTVINGQFLKTDASGNLSWGGIITGLEVSGVSTFTSDINVGVSTAAGLILTSPNGTRYRLIVANDGTLSTTAV